MTEHREDREWAAFEKWFASISRGRYYRKAAWEAWQARSAQPDREERAEFEKWAKGKKLDITHWAENSEAYARQNTQFAWSLWNSISKARSSQPVAGQAEQELARIKELLSDPRAVWSNILTGQIAKPAAIAHLEARLAELEAAQPVAGTGEPKS